MERILHMLNEQTIEEQLQDIMDRTNYNQSSIYI